MGVNPGGTGGHVPPLSEGWGHNIKCPPPTYQALELIYCRMAYDWSNLMEIVHEMPPKSVFFDLRIVKTAIFRALRA